MWTSGNPDAPMSRFVTFATLALCAAAGTDGIRAQQPPLQPPAPIGTPLVERGPVANPFGPPPVPIDAQLPFYDARAPFVYPPVGPPFAYPAVPYPTSPYRVRRPAPFDSAAAPYNGLRYPSQPVPDRRMMPADPIGPANAAPPMEQVRAFYGPAPINAAFQSPAPIGNVRLSVSEAFLNRLVARDEQRPGEVRDFVLGAQVSGRQITNTRLRFDLLPSAEQIRGVMHLTGITNSQTTGVTPQAMVDVASQQNFVATKELYFDGMKFTTRHAVVRVQAKNQTLGATTPLSGTLFGGLADRIAYKAAERRQTEAEAVARDRVAERVYPEFDTQIDKQLGLANDQLELTVRPFLRSANLMPTQQQTWSTDQSLNYAAQIGADSSVGSAAALESRVAREAGATVLVHESLLNFLVERSGLKGLKTTDKQMKSYLAQYEVKSTGDELQQAEPPISLPGMENVVTDIEFDETDPLTIRIDQDRTLVTIRASFKPAGQNILPPLAVAMEFKTELSPDKIIVTPGKVQVKAQNDDGNSPPGVAMTLISKAIESSLAKLAFDRSVPASLWTLGGPVPRVSNISSQDGWAAIYID